MSGKTSVARFPVRKSLAFDRAAPETIQAVRHEELGDTLMTTTRRNLLVHGSVVGAGMIVGNLPGIMALAQGQPGEAIALFQDAAHDQPTFALAHYYLGLALVANNNLPSAKIALSEAIKLTPHLVEAHLALIHLHMHARNFDQAIEAAQSFLTLQPDNPVASLAVGEAYMGQKDIVKAITAFQTAIAQAPKDAKNHYYLGLAYLAQHKEPEALAAFEQALALNPHALEPLVQIVALFNRALDKALQRVQTQLQASPQNALMYTLLGQLYSRQQNDTEAEAAFKKALELDEGTVRAHLDLASLYARKKAYDQALTLYEALLKRNPKLVPGYTSAGMIYDAKGDRQKANEYYQKALKIDPKFVPALNNLAWNYAEYGSNLTTALTYARTAQEAEPNNPEVADTLGWIYFRTKDYIKAVDLLKESAEKIPDNPVVRYHLGMACYKKGDVPCAKEALQQALRLSRDFPEAEEAKQTLVEIGLASN